MKNQTYLGTYRKGSHKGKRYIHEFSHRSGNVDYYHVWEVQQDDFKHDKPKGDLDMNFIKRASAAFGFTPTGKRKK
jgi:hypothetical protein